MAKAYIKELGNDGHEIRITLLHVYPEGEAKIGIRTNAQEGHLRKEPSARPWEHLLKLGESVTVVIED